MENIISLKYLHTNNIGIKCKIFIMYCISTDLYLRSILWTNNLHNIINGK